MVITDLRPGQISVHESSPELGHTVNEPVHYISVRMWPQAFASSVGVHAPCIIDWITSSRPNW